MTVLIATVECGGPGLMFPGRFTDDYAGGNTPSVLSLSNRDNRMSPCEAYQEILEGTDRDVIVYVHDDVTIEPTLISTGIGKPVPKPPSVWLDRVMALFENPDCAVVGLGGATRLGHPDLYKRPYRISDMARGSYVSNQTDWQTHGGLETGSKRVAVLDAFFMAVRRDFLEKIGGWPVKHLSHHLLDLFICCEAARHEKEVWMTGVSVTHHGGGSSTKPIYAEAKWLQGGTLESDHQAPHRWLYDSYRDCLPISI